MTSALAAVLRSRSGSFVLEDLAVNGPKDDELLIAITGSGICHTDLGVRDGFRNVPLPVVLGHEGAGVVEAIGPGVNDFTVGDAVVIGFPFCGECKHCTTGRQSNCREFDDLWHRCSRRDGSHAFHGAQGLVRGFFAGQSSFSSHVLVSARQAVKLPRGTDTTLLGPLGCGISTGAGAVLNALKVIPGSSIAVFGMGAVGLSAVMAAQVAGCAQIVAIDTNSARLNLASSLGATAVVNASDDRVVERVRDACDGGADFAVEAAGLPSVVREAVASLDAGGDAVYVGNHPEGATFDLPVNSLEWNQTLSGSNLGHSVPREFIPYLIGLHSEGRFPFDRLIRAYPFAEINQAIADAESGATVKPVLVMP